MLTVTHAVRACFWEVSHAIAFAKIASRGSSSTNEFLVKTKIELEISFFVTPTVYNAGSNLLQKKSSSETKK